MIPSRSHLLGYAVVVAVSVALACALTERSYLPKDLTIGLAFGLLAGFYEWQKAERKRIDASRIIEMVNRVRNHCQVICGFSYIPPEDREKIIALQVEGIKVELAGVVMGSPAGYPSRSAAAENPVTRKKPMQRLKTKTQRTGTFS